jgi:hypothetical protein
VALLFLAAALLLFACWLDSSPRTRLSSPAKPGGCGPKASHSAPPRADYREPVRFVCGQCGMPRTLQCCEWCRLTPPAPVC